MIEASPYPLRLRQQLFGEGSHLWQALSRRRHKSTVFLTTVLMIVIIVGSLMYMIAGAESGFTSIH